MCIYRKRRTYNVISKTSNGDCILIYSGSNDFTEVVLIENISKQFYILENKNHYYS